MNSIIIGSGWLGLPLAERLRKNGHTVFSTQRSPVKEGNGNILQFPSADGSTEKLISGADVVVLAFPPSRTALDTYAGDCLAVLSLLKPECRMLMISSTGVYPDNNKLAEETAVVWNEMTDNRIAFAEQALHEKAGERLTILRLAGLVGAGRYPAIPMSRSGKTYSSSEPVNLIHLEDAVGLAAFLIGQNNWGILVNGCAKEHPLKGAYYSWMAGKLGIQPPVFEDSEFAGKVIASEKSRELGYEYIYDDPYNFL